MTLATNDANAYLDDARARGVVTPELEAELAAAERQAQELEARTAGRETAARIRRNAARNAVIRLTLMESRRTYNRLEGWVDACMNSRVFGVEGGSVAFKQELSVARYLGGLVADLESTGMLAYAAARLRDAADPRKWGKGPLDDKIAEELWELSVEGGAPGRTGLDEAAKVAAIIYKYQELAREDLTKLGVVCEQAPGRIVAHAHDAARIAQTEFAQWRQAAERAFGNDRTYGKVQFTGDQAQDSRLIAGFWSEAYDRIRRGDLYRAVDESPAEDRNYLAGETSPWCALHPNGAKAWIDYNDRFGASSLMEAVFIGLERAGKTAGLIEALGTAPRALYADMIETARRHDLKVGRPVEKRFVTGGAISRLWEAVDGTADIPARVSLVQIDAAARRHGLLSYRGRAALDRLPDLARAGGALRDDFGRNLLSAALESVRNKLGLCAGQDRQRDMALFAHVGLEAIIREVPGRLSASDTGSWQSEHKNVDAILKANVLTHLTDAADRASAQMLNVRLAQLRDTAMANLPGGLRTALERYGIGEREWDIVRKHTRHPYGVGEKNWEDVRADRVVRHPKDDDIAMLLADKLRDMPLRDIDPLVVFPAEELRREMSGAYGPLSESAAQASAALSVLRNAQPQTADHSGAAAVIENAATFVDALLSGDRTVAGAPATFEEVEALTKANLARFDIFRRDLGTLHERMRSAKTAPPEVLQAVQQAADAMKEQRIVMRDCHGRLQRELDRRRALALRDLEARFESFFINSVHAGVLREGAPLEHALALVAQFKANLPAFLQVMLGRGDGNDFSHLVPGSPDRHIAVELTSPSKRIAELVVLLTVMGYLSLALKDIAHGKEPADPHLPQTFADAFVHGGGAGLYCDHLFARRERQRAALPPDAAANAYPQLDFSYPSSPELNDFRNTSKNLNLFYTRAALDYLILYHIQDTLSPGALSGLQRKLVQG